MKYYVSLKKDNRLTPKMAEIVENMELQTYEERFSDNIEEIVEVYKIGTKRECEDFLKNIEDVLLRDEFEITSVNI